LILALKIRKKLQEQIDFDVSVFTEKQLERIKEIDRWLMLKDIYLYNEILSLQKNWFALIGSRNNRLDWLWKGLSLALMAASQVALISFTSLFFSNNKILAGVLLLFQFGLGKFVVDNLGDKHQYFFQKLVYYLKVPQEWEWEIIMVISFLIFGLSLGVNVYIPEAYSNYLNQQGEVLIEERKYYEAQELFESSNSVFPSNPQTLHYLGFLADLFQEKDKAEKYYRKSINNIHSLNNLAKIHIESGKYNEAVQFLLSGIAVAKDNRTKYYLYKNLGEARIGQGVFDEAIANLNKAISLEPRPEAFCLLGDAYERQGDFVTELGFRQECFKKTQKKPELDSYRIKSLRRINEIKSGN